MKEPTAEKKFPLDQMMEEPQCPQRLDSIRRRLAQAHCKAATISDGTRSKQ